VCLGEVNISVSGTCSADFTGLRSVWPFTARLGLANARPRSQYWLEEPVIRWMSVNIPETKFLAVKLRIH